MHTGGLSHPEHTSNLHLWDGLELQYGSTYGCYTNQAGLRMQMHAKKKKKKAFVVSCSQIVIEKKVGMMKKISAHLNLDFLKLLWVKTRQANTNIICSVL